MFLTGLQLGVVLLLAHHPPHCTCSLSNHYYNVSRDYENVRSENYPAPYPTDQTYRWGWSVGQGHWGVYFVDFKLACGQGTPSHDGDQLFVNDELDQDEPRRIIVFGCQTQEEKTSHLVRGAHFTMELRATTRDQQARGFNAVVLYGTTQSEVETKINKLKAAGVTRPPKDDESSFSSASHLIIPLIVTIIVFLALGVGLGLFVVLRRRHHHHQQTNTSVHLSIGGIRRSEAAISYTRNGNGPLGGARTRMNSDESAASEAAGGATAGLPRGRSVTRSDSSASSSWAQRAEMTGQARHGSCSSDAGTPTTKRHNSYTPFPEKDAGSRTGSSSDSGSGDSVCDLKSLTATSGGADRKKKRSVHGDADGADRKKKSVHGDADGADRKKKKSVHGDADGAAKARRAVYREKGKKKSVSEEDEDGDDAVFEDNDTKKKQQHQHQHQNKACCVSSSVELTSSKRKATTSPPSTTGQSCACRNSNPKSCQPVAEDVVDNCCRLSTISEESRSSASLASKLRVTLPVSKTFSDQPALAIANSGYILMTSCTPASSTPDYVNFDGE